MPDPDNDPAPPTEMEPAPVQRRRGRLGRVVGCVLIGLLLLVISPVALIFAFVAADRVVFQLTGDCVPTPMTSDACRGSYSFDVWNQTSDAVDIVVIRPDGTEFLVMDDVAPRTFGTNDGFVVAGGRCAPSLHLVARTDDGRIVAERTGICRREDWIIVAP